MNSRSQTREYTIQRLSDDNLTDVEKLHTAVYGKLPPHNFFQMKYDTAFTGIKHIGFIAYNNQKLPIAFYAVIPCFIRFDDKNMLAAQSADTMTHPQYRSKGLFVELALQTFHLCRNSGIYLLFGFPNQNSLPGFINKLGWQRTKNLDCFIIRTAIFSWERLFNKFSPLKNLYGRYQQSIFKKYLLPQQGVPNSVFYDGYAGVYRDHHYLRYKTYTNNQVIKIDNSILWIKISNIFLIGDISVIPGEFGDMMYKLKKLARNMGIREIHFHASPGTPLHALFARDFNSTPSFPVIFMDFEGGAPTDKIKFTSADIDTF
jgi:hypothetical protein